MGIGNIGLPGLLLLLVIAFIMVFPFWKLLPKFGFPKWLALLAIIPVFQVIFVWMMAFSEPVRTNKETMS